MSFPISPQVNGRSNSSNRKTVLGSRSVATGQIDGEAVQAYHLERQRKGMVRFRYGNPQFSLTRIPTSCLAKVSSVPKGMALRCRISGWARMRNTGLTRKTMPETRISARKRKEKSVKPVPRDDNTAETNIGLGDMNREEGGGVQSGSIETSSTLLRIHPIAIQTSIFLTTARPHSNI